MTQYKNHPRHSSLTLKLAVYSSFGILAVLLLVSSLTFHSVEGRAVLPPPQPDDADKQPETAPPAPAAHKDTFESNEKKEESLHKSQPNNVGREDTLKQPDDLDDVDKIVEKEVLAAKDSKGHKGLSHHDEELKQKEQELLEIVSKKIRNNPMLAKKIQREVDLHLEQNPESTDENESWTELQKANQARRESFKRHQMLQELKIKEELLRMNEEERAKALAKIEEEKVRLRNHEPVAHPGTIKQLKAIYDKKGIDGDINAVILFRMYDMNEDATLDVEELEAIFVTEAQKIFPDEKDSDKRHEEIARMREHFMEEIDTNRDAVVSKDEFVQSVSKLMAEQRSGLKSKNDTENTQPATTASADKKEDEMEEKEEGWQDIGDQELFTAEELEAFQFAEQIEGQINNM